MNLELRNIIKENILKERKLEKTVNKLQTFWDKNAKLYKSKDSIKALIEIHDFLEVAEKEVASLVTINEKQELQLQNTCNHEISIVNGNKHICCICGKTIKPDNANTIFEIAYPANKDNNLELWPILNVQDKDIIFIPDYFISKAYEAGIALMGTEANIITLCKIFKIIDKAIHSNSPLNCFMASMTEIQSKTEIKVKRLK